MSLSTYRGSTYRGSTHRDSTHRGVSAGRRNTALFLAASLLLSACASSGTRPSNPSAEQSSLYNYSDSFPAQGAAIGAVAGAILGCAIGALASRNKGAGCAIGAAAGGVGGAALGAGGGYLARANQQRYASEEQRLASLTRAADLELEQARNARRDAEQIVQGHRSKIASLQEGYKARAVSEQTLERAVEEARYDRDQIARASEGIEGQISEIQSSIDQSAGSNSPNLRALVQRRNGLLAERNMLNQQLVALDIEIDRAEALLS